MQAQRYQRGSLGILKRKSQPDAWAFRYYAEEGGRRVYKRRIIGTVLEFPKRRDAERQLMQLRVDINEGAEFAPINVEQLATHFKNVEAPQKSYSTREGYKKMLDNQVIPRWGNYSLAAIKSIEVENWLRKLPRKDGRPASPATKSKIRNVMSAIFSHAIRYGWASHNPITAVRTSAKRLHEPDILTPEEFQGLLVQLDQRERLLVLLAGTTGLRRGELIALRWEDIDFVKKVVNVTHAIWHNVEGETKTPASRKPVPLQPLIVQELTRWRKSSLYHSDKDYLFPSIQRNGTQPLQPEMVLRRHIRPALARMGVTKKIGWHSFRHGFSNLLRENRVDVKVAQELLRHANSRITLDIYQRTVTDERRAAQELVCKDLLGDQGLETLKNPKPARKEEVRSLIN
jgi:Site-specific recombinase XerD